MSEHKNSRHKRTLLIDRRFQLKYTAMIIGLATVVSGVLGIFLFRTVRENSRMLQVEAGFDEAFQTELARSDAQVLLVLAAAFGVFLAVLFVVSVVITHHVAGPIFVMKRWVKQLGDGTLPRLRKLRKGDEFVDFFETLRGALESMERRAQQELTVLEAAHGALAETPGAEGEKARDALSTLIREKKKMLEERIHLE